jgi:hypothetical protein
MNDKGEVKMQNNTQGNVPSLAEWLRPWEDFFQKANQSALDAYGAWTKVMEGYVPAMGKGRCKQCNKPKGECACHEECGDKHKKRGCDKCECEICDADLVVYARPGEKRMVPILVENHRPRERAIQLELSSFGAANGSGATNEGVQGQLDKKELKLAPCSEETVWLSVTTGQRAVEGCQVFYANLRLNGCRPRPLVIAVAVLGKDCQEHRVDCGCCEC